MHQFCSQRGATEMCWGFVVVAFVPIPAVAYICVLLLSAVRICLTLSLPFWHHMMSLVKYFLSACEMTGGSFLEVRFLMHAQEQQSWRKRTFLVGWIPLRDSCLMELCQEHKFSGRKRVNKFIILMSQTKTDTYMKPGIKSTVHILACVHWVQCTSKLAWFSEQFKGA